MKNDEGQILPIVVNKANEGVFWVVNQGQDQKNGKFDNFLT